MVNIKEVAKITGYSIGTVSKALNGYPDINEKTREKIQKAANELGYVPSSFGQNLVSRKSYTVGIVFEENTGFGLAHPFFGELLNVIKSEIEKQGYDILLLSKNVGTYVRSYLDHCIQKGVDGVMVLSAGLDTKNYQRLVESKLPIVLIDFENKEKNTVYTNNYSSTRSAVRYLIENNHKDIAYIKGDIYRFIGRERYSGYLDEMEESNLPINPEYIFDAFSYSTEDGIRVADEIAKLDKKPTAVVCVADAVAIGLIKRLSELNIKVPEEISVIGFDDILLANLINPALTTIAQDKGEIGRIASKLLIDNILDKNLRPVNVQVEGKLIVRNTVKKL